MDVGKKIFKSVVILECLSLSRYNVRHKLNICIINTCTYNLLTNPTHIVFMCYYVPGSKMTGTLLSVLMLLCGYVLADPKRFDGYVLAIT